MVRRVRAKSTVGYAGLYCAERDTRVATLPLGYADGVPVAASNRGEVLIRGQRFRIAGRVSMDATGVDVGEAPVEGDGSFYVNVAGDVPFYLEILDDVGRPLHTMRESYLHALVQAGAMPLILPLIEDEEKLRTAYERLDGLLLAGGGDIDPAMYGEPCHPATGNPGAIVWRRP